MSTEHSAIWSSLRTLELTRQFASTHVEPAKAYYPSFLGNDSDKKVYKRRQKLASALALISASSPDANTVIACSVEVSYQEGSGAPTVILRIAQNKRIDEAELENLQMLVDRLVRQISVQQESVWSCKVARDHTINSIVAGHLLPLVVERCQDKLSRILNGPYSKPFRDWHAKVVDSNTLDSIALESSQVINHCSSDRVHSFNNANDIADAVTCAYVITEGYADSLEHQWAVYDPKTSQNQVTVDMREENVQGEQVGRGWMDVGQQDTEDLDDRESLDPDEMNKSSIYRFLRKLSRYHIACHVVTSELVALVRLGAEANIKVETVPVSTTTSTPAKENEYPSLQCFLERTLRVDIKSLDAKKVGRLCDSWPHDMKSQNLFLHAEMQMALFYALNPQLYPIHGFIGMSKKCCWCCDFVLKHLQLPGEKANRYNEDVAGSPLLFSVGGTHNRKYTAWVFPNPSTHIEYHSLDSIFFERVRCRFNLVRQDLERALVSDVNDIVGQLQKLECKSDSSDMSGEGYWVGVWTERQERTTQE